LLDLFLGGGTGAGQQAVLLAGSFTELSYSRGLEREADTRAMELLHAAGLSSQGLAPFFERMANRRSSEQARAAAEFLGSHPDSLRRAERARAAGRPGRPALDAVQWADVRRLCRTPQARR
jgi:predicted Zn-dependent protease